MTTGACKRCTILMALVGAQTATTPLAALAGNKGALESIRVGYDSDIKRTLERPCRCQEMLAMRPAQAAPKDGGAMMDYCRTCAGMGDTPDGHRCPDCGGTRLCRREIPPAPKARRFVCASCRGSGELPKGALCPCCGGKGVCAGWCRVSK